MKKLVGAREGRFVGSEKMGFYWLGRSGSLF